MGSRRTRHARELFASVAASYEQGGRLLSLGREAGWRRFLVGRVRADAGSVVLDVASGTGLVARELAARHGSRVVQLDPSIEMLRAGISAAETDGSAEPLVAVQGRAESLPFGDEAFDALTFTYLLRYVDDPAATVAELVRVLRAAGSMASLEFHVPERRPFWVPWWVYTRVLMPVLGATLSPAWSRTARFLGPSISTFVAEHPLPIQVRWWQDAGMTEVHTRTFLWGTAVVTWGMKA